MVKPILGERGEPNVDLGIRVFISSTFRDMQQERDILIRRIFPQLRSLCEERGATWSEVDLRWGVTDEEAAKGRALAICLDEIDRCRPFFMALLGDRYGWIPPSLPNAVEQRHPWLSQFRDRSITEIEIRYAALEHPRRCVYSHFYLRKPNGLEAHKEPGRGTEKLADLKRAIRESGLPLREFDDPLELGALVLEDYRNLIDALFPVSRDFNAVDREMARHLAFARNRARVFVNRAGALDHLDRHRRAKSSPLVIVGEPGSGKSTLLAAWVTRLANSTRSQDRDREPPRTSRIAAWLRKFRGEVDTPAPLVLAHFSGVDPVDDWRPLCGALLRWLNHRLGLGIELPSGADALRAAFANALYRAATRTRLVLVLDGVDELTGSGQPPRLDWLPPNVPPQIRLVFSTTPGPLVQEASARKWRALKIETLSAKERAKMARKTLEIYRKRLSPKHLRRILSAAQSGNPLFLRLLLEELRVFGEHERLGNQIDHCLSAADAEALYILILERLENDFERDRSGLVRDLMTFLWASRRGLSEAEVRTLLGAGGEPLPSTIWSPLSLAVEGALISGRGGISFHHSQLRRAVERRYLPREESRRAIRLKLVSRFSEAATPIRQIEECPWQLYRAAAWPALREALSESSFLELAWTHAPLDVQTYWTALMSHGETQVADAYRHVLSRPCENPPLARMVGALLRRLGFLADALPVYRDLVESSRQAGHLETLQSDLGDLALVLRSAGDLRGSLAFLQEQERLCRASGNRASISRCLGNQGILHVDLGEPRKALALHSEEESLCRKSGDEEGLGRCLGNQARAHFALGDAAAALRSSQAQARIARDHGDLISYHAALGNQGIVLAIQGDLGEALALHRQEAEICRTLGDREGLQASLVPQARLLARQGDFDSAMDLLKDQERLCREIPSPSGLADGLLCQAALYLNLGTPKAARDRLAEVESLAHVHHLVAQAREAQRLLEASHGRTGALS